MEKLVLIATVVALMYCVDKWVAWSATLQKDGLVCTVDAGM